MFLSGIRKILLWHKIKCWEIATFEYLVYGNKESNILDNRFFFKTGVNIKIMIFYSHHLLQIETAANYN